MLFSLNYRQAAILNVNALLMCRNEGDLKMPQRGFFSGGANTLHCNLVCVQKKVIAITEVQKDEIIPRLRMGAQPMCYNFVQITIVYFFPLRILDQYTIVRHYQIVFYSTGRPFLCSSIVIKNFFVMQQFYSLTKIFFHIFTTQTQHRLYPPVI